MKDTVESQDKLVFILNGKPYIPGQDKPVPEQPKEENNVDKQSSD